MTQTLREFVDSRGVSLRVDRQSGIIQGVKILGLKSRNGRTYLPEALKQAAALYENAKVNVNHPQGDPGRPRDYQDRIGMIRHVTVRDDGGLFADFHFNPKHALAEQLAWDAEHAPENVGFSHNVRARCTRRDGQVVVEAITQVQSVDLVADPATTRGLFEAAAENESDRSDAREPEEDTRRPPRNVEELKRDYPELVDTLLSEQADELGRLRAEVERLAELEAAGRRQRTVRRLLSEYQLPPPEATDPQARLITSERFLESLTAAQSEPAMRALVEERARLVRGLGSDALRGAAVGKPLARDPHGMSGVRSLDAKAFVEAIT